MPTLVAIRWEPSVKEHYDRLLARGKLPMVAIVAVMRKLLQCVWRMILTNTRFDGVRYAPRIPLAA